MFNKTVNRNGLNLVRTMFSTNISPIIDYLDGVMCEDSVSPSDTPYLIYATLESMRAELDLSSGIKTEEYAKFRNEVLTFMHTSGMGMWFHTFEDKMSSAFADYVAKYLNSDKLPKDKDCTIEIIASLCYFISAVSDDDNPEAISYCKPLKEVANKLREVDGYRRLASEYDAQKPNSVDEDIIKSLDPVDISSIPEYVIDSLYRHGSYYYKPSDIRKMITASSQTAQALERQDLEDKITPTNTLTAEEEGRAYIKRLKLKRMGKKNENKGNLDR